jgi:hypothetical protein
VHRRGECYEHLTNLGVELSFEMLESFLCLFFLLVMGDVDVDLGNADVRVRSVLADVLLDRGVLGLGVGLEVDVLLSIFDFSSVDAELMLRVLYYRVGWDDALSWSVDTEQLRIVVSFEDPALERFDDFRHGE